MDPLWRSAMSATYLGGRDPSPAHRGITETQGCEPIIISCGWVPDSDSIFPRLSMDIENRYIEIRRGRAVVASVTAEQSKSSPRRRYAAYSSPIRLPMDRRLLRK